MRFEQLLLGEEPHDAGPAVLCVRAGAGGVDAEDFTRTLIGMYIAYAQRRGWKITELEVTAGREGGVRSWTAQVSGHGAYGLLAAEHGAHRVAHHSRFGRRGKRQTSFASVEVLPWEPQAANELNVNDVRLDAYAGSSKGGQHANRSHTNIRAVHVPTQISAVSQGRSLTQNRQAALTVLAARVAALHADRQAAARSAQTVSAGFGGRVRSYTFTPYQLVCDERCGYKSRKLDALLSGDLDDLTRSLLLWRRLTARQQ